MSEKCRYCGSGEMILNVKRFEDGRTLEYRCCTWCGHCENDPDRSKRRATTLAASQRQFNVEG